MNSELANLPNEKNVDIDLYSNGRQIAGHSVIGVTHPFAFVKWTCKYIGPLEVL